MENDDSIDKIIKFFLKPAIIVEFGVITYSLIGIESWWSIGLAVILPPIIALVKPMYITAFISLSAYFTYVVGSGMLEKYGWGGAIVVGSIVLALTLAIHAYAFLEFKNESKETEVKKEESEEVKDEVA